APEPLDLHSWLPPSGAGATRPSFVASAFRRRSHSTFIRGFRLQAPEPLDLHSWLPPSGGRCGALQSLTMRNACRWLAGATAVGAMLAGPPARSQVRALVLDDVRVVDGTGAAPIEHGRIVIQGDRIAQVGQRATVQAPAGAETVDLAGRTIVPGLIDLHFHIENDPKLA